MLEVPSGAWADTVDRRWLLILSGIVYAAAFAFWIVWPTYLGFAIGFVLWGASSALMSGTFEALVYDELDPAGLQRLVPPPDRLRRLGSMVATLLATAAPRRSSRSAATRWSGGRAWALRCYMPPACRYTPDRAADELVDETAALADEVIDTAGRAGRYPRC